MRQHGVIGELVHACNCTWLCSVSIVSVSITYTVSVKSGCAA